LRGERRECCRPRMRAGGCPRVLGHWVGVDRGLGESRRGAGGGSRCGAVETRMREGQRGRRPRPSCRQDEDGGQPWLVVSRRVHTEGPGPSPAVFHRDLSARPVLPGSQPSLSRPIPRNYERIYNANAPVYTPSPSLVSQVLLRSDLEPGPRIQRLLSPRRLDHGTQSVLPSNSTLQERTASSAPTLRIR
jgi:hypothetical protein